MKSRRADGFKELIDYSKSEENLQNGEPFEQLNQKYSLLQRQYAHSFQTLSSGITAKVYKRKYSKGGLTIHRGFYSPSALVVSL